MSGLSLVQNQVDPKYLAAENVVAKTYGDRVSVVSKGKFLNKFGRNRSVGTGFEAISELQGATSAIPHPTTNLIDSMGIDNAADTSLTYTVEGHSVDGSGNMTFVVQNATTDALDGRTKVTLSTPVRDVTRAYRTSSGSFGTTPVGATGNIYFYDDTDGVAATGIPNTAADTCLVLLAGETQSEKAATSISSTDYWFITYLSCDIADATGPTNFATVRMQIWDVANGEAWRPLGRDFILWPDTSMPTVHFDPCLIVPKNHDWQIIAKSDGGTSTIQAEAGGALAAVVGAV